jgi:cobalt/nickel transport system permease protein
VLDLNRLQGALISMIHTTLLSLGLFSGWFSGYFQPRIALHIPDGVLSPPVWGGTWILSIGLIALALRHVQAEYQDRTVPLMGVCAAFIFAAQMINFPIPGGTSGHLLGGTLAGALLGPWAGSLVMAVVFIVQAVLFQDGGITTMGANIFNMGLIGTFGGYYLFRSVRFAIGQNKLAGMVTGTAIAAWSSVVVAAIFTAIQLGLSGSVPLGVALTAMVGWHLLIGMGEAMITVATVVFIWRTRPDLFHQPPRKVKASVPRSLSMR